MTNYLVSTTRTIYFITEYNKKLRVHKQYQNELIVMNFTYLKALEINNFSLVHITFNLTCNTCIQFILYMFETYFKYFDISSTIYNIIFSSILHFLN